MLLAVRFSGETMAAPVTSLTAGLQSRTISQPMARDQQLRENRILDAARRLFIHYGYNKISVAEIVQEAGVSKGAVYLHFSSKDDLLHRLLKREMMRYAEDWHQRIEADPEGGTIGGIYRHILAAMKANPFIHAVMAHSFPC